MWPLKQLLRSPVMTTMVVLLLLIASTFMTLSVGVYSAAIHALTSLERNFAVVAYPSPHTLVDNPTGKDAYAKSVFDQYAKQFLDGAIQNPDFVEKIDTPCYVNGHAPGVRSVLSTEFPWKSDRLADIPHQKVLLEVVMKEVGEPLWYEATETYLDANGKETTNEVKRILVRTKAEIVRYLVSHEKQVFRGNKVAADVLFEGSLEYREPFEIGKHYLVYGDYSDNYLVATVDMAESMGVDPEELDSTYIPYTEEEVAAEIEQIKKLEDVEEVDPNVIPIGRFYNRQLGKSIVVSQSWFDQREMGFLSNASIIKLPISPEELELWKMRCAMSHAQFPVIGTDQLERLLDFHLGECLITDGRTFQEQEYTNGGRVCILSEELAKANDLKVGDTIDWAFAVDLDGVFYGSLANPMVTNVLIPQEVKDDIAFSSADSYTIVGLYRIKNAWNNEFFSITPSTVFVPKKSLPIEGRALDFGDYYAVQLNKRNISAFRSEMAEAKVSDVQIRIFDNGYEQIKHVLHSFGESAMWLFVVSLLVCIVVLVIYAMLFVRRRRRDAGLMISLGASKCRAVKHILVISLIPVVVATLVGIVAGSALVGTVTNQIYGAAIELGTEASEVLHQPLPSTGYWGAVAALVQAGVYALVTWMVARWIVAESPLTLVKK